MGYSVIRAGTLAMAAAAVVSWLTPYPMGPRALLHALELGARMALQLVAVCAAAGIIVGVIALTGLGTRFSSLLLGLAGNSQLAALFFAMVVSIILGMGMPTTAAYAVAASVIAPGLVQLGIAPLMAHFFIFYFAVMSAITPPVALAAYAGAAIAQSDPMKTSVESFRIGLAAFVVPFMFFSSPALLMQGTWGEIVHVAASATFGVFLLSAAVQGWFFGHLSPVLRGLLLLAAFAMIDGGWLTDAVGIAAALIAWAVQKGLLSARSAARGSD
jgi:TRAP transporter 4TM/12TM fusion protein